MGRKKGKLNVFMAQFYRDQVLKNQYERPEWVYPLQVGKALTDTKVAALADDKGENISAKNPNYCELTALYWIWKNRLVRTSREGLEYYGLFHYRRILELTNDDLYRLGRGETDIILPFPTIHEPNSLEHHIPDSALPAPSSLHPSQILKYTGYDVPGYWAHVWLERVK